MSARSTRDPSPFRSGLIHSALGAFTLTAALGAGAGAVHLVGNTSDASPNIRVALFDENPTGTPQLNPRLPGYQEAIGLAQASSDTSQPETAGPEPDLGVEYTV